MPKNSEVDNYSCCEAHNTASYTIVLSAANTAVIIEGLSDGQTSGFDVFPDKIIFKKGRKKHYLFNGAANFEVDKLCVITLELYQNGLPVPGTRTGRGMDHANSGVQLSATQILNISKFDEIQIKAESDTPNTTITVTNFSVTFWKR